jgi:hypothetical protein
MMCVFCRVMSEATICRSSSNSVHTKIIPICRNIFTCEFLQKSMICTEFRHTGDPVFHPHSCLPFLLSSLFVNERTSNTNIRFIHCCLNSLQNVKAVPSKNVNHLQPSATKSITKLHCVALCEHQR